MISRVLVKLICVFLLSYISITSATPARRAALVKAQNTNDDTQALAPRGYYPQYQCQYPFVWKRRECTANPGDWQDVCVQTRDDGSTSETKYMTVNKPGVCAGFAFCLDILVKLEGAQRITWFKRDRDFLSPLLWVLSIHLLFLFLFSWRGWFLNLP